MTARASHHGVHARLSRCLECIFFYLPRAFFFDLLFQSSFCYAAAQFSLLKPMCFHIFIADSVILLYDFVTVIISCGLELKETHRGIFNLFYTDFSTRSTFFRRYFQQISRCFSLFFKICYSLTDVHLIFYPTPVDN